jgi:regulatory protein
MPVITKILEQKRRANRRNVHIDGRFAFGCNLNVIAKFRLREGMNLTLEQIEAIKQGEIRQECFDVAMDYLTRRLHSRAELTRKLLRKEYLPDMIADVLNDLERMGYVDDARFAKTKAMSAAQHKHHGKRRAQIELMKAGVDRDTANRAVEDVYDVTDSLAIARELARKRAPSLKRFDPLVAKRRLVGMLLRRGFDYDTIKPVIDEVLGHSQDEE